MFTGIVEETGTVRAIRRGDRSAVVEIEAAAVKEGLRPGDSVAVNGVCLTASALHPYGFSADVMPETMSRSNLGGLRAGDRVNLERAMAADGRFGGHIVSGHVDGTGVISRRERDGNAVLLSVSVPSGLSRYIVEKGSVAVDGISLTVTAVSEEEFSVSVIPHTMAHTTLTAKRVGERVNIENDVIAKYVERLLAPAPEKRGGGLSLDFLAANGF